jgi:hypothetical protein
MAEQNYQNHTNRPTAFLIVSLMLFLTLIGACVNLYESWGDHQRLYSASLILVLTLCALAIPSILRLSMLKAQDRAIRAEQALRHFIATGKPLDPRLTLGQIIALRFASDAEYVDLARRAADEGLAPDDIKRAVKNWRPDTHRV